MRRKGYQKWNNHRQSFTQILVQGILNKGETLKDEIAVEKKVRVGTPAKHAKATAEIEEKKAPAKKAPAKKAAAKKVTKKKED